jgi:hypothetical protein
MSVPSPGDEYIFETDSVQLVFDYSQIGHTKEITIKVFKLIPQEESIRQAEENKKSEAFPVNFRAIIQKCPRSFCDRGHVRKSLCNYI